MFYAVASAGVDWSGGFPVLVIQAGGPDKLVGGAKSSMTVLSPERAAHRFRELFLFQICPVVFQYL